MKTIFIAIFEGAEAKNIMRTPVLATLLTDPSLRIVLFTKSEERVNYYQKEFNDPRLIYEVVKVPPPRGLDRLFSNLKFTLLRTATTDLKRRMALEESGSYLNFALGFLVNRIFARPFIRRIVRWLDFHFVRERTFEPFFEHYQPNLVFLAHLFDEPEIHLLRTAKKMGVKNVGFINSWDKATARCIIRLLPDKFIVFNDIVKKELVRHNEVLGKDIFISGLPQYDQYARPVALSRSVFFQGIGFGPEIKRVLVYAPNGRYSQSVDGGMINLLLSFMEEELVPADVGLIVRFQPNDFVDMSTIRPMPKLVCQIPGIRFSGERGIDWDMDSKDIALLVNTLFHASLFICYTSSLSVDAAVFGKPVINVDFELNKHDEAMRSPTSFYKMEHYKNAIATGGIRIVKSREELVRWINRYLDNGAFDRAGREILVRQQCGSIDGRAGERAGRFILDFLYE